MKRSLRLIVLACSLLIAAGCTGKKAAELFETAQFEEKQNNREHAAKLYNEILAKHPQSEFAAKAKERLEALGKVK